MPKHPLPNMADVAKKCGCSPATVSLALRGDPRISAATKARVRKAAETMGYRPDPVLAALVARRDFGRARRTFANIAALVDDRWFVSKSTQWHQSFLDGIKACCERLGYSLDVLHIARDLGGAQNQDRILRGRGVRGIVLMPLCDGQVPLRISWENYAVVALGYPPEPFDFHRVGRDGFAAIKLACERVTTLGYKRLGLAHSGVMEARFRYEWLSGMFKEGYVRAKQISIVPPCLPEEFAEENFIAWVKRESPDCVFSGDAIVLTWLRAAGYRIPKDIGVVLLSRDVSHLPTAAGVSSHLESFGETAIEQLHALLMRGETGLPKVSKEILIGPHWIDGETLRRVTS